MSNNLQRLSNKKQVYDIMVKLIIVGDSGVGKTNILTRFCEDQFKQTHIATIGVDFNVKTIQIDDKRLRLQIWDTAGQQRFKSITQTYYRGAAGMILVYAVDSLQSFEYAQKLIEQVAIKLPSTVNRILVANKIDIKQQQRLVSQKEGKQLSEKYNMQYMQTSARTNQGIDEIFYTMSKLVKDKVEQQTLNNTYTITLNSTKQQHNVFDRVKQINGCKC